MKPSEMRSLLESEGIRLSRRLGQHFMHDAHQLDRMVAVAELQEGMRVLEIGPGLGPLTERLLRAGARVLALEKDVRLARLLEERLGGDPRLEVRVVDALDFLREEKPDLGEWRVVSNLPYSVASPLLVELAGLERPPVRLVVTVQAEVADRIVADAGEPAYGLLTLLIRQTYEPGQRFRIPATCFYPVPKVESACVLLERRPGVPAELRPVFLKLVRRAFSQRRKQMFKLLRADWPEAKLREAFERVGLSREVRGEAVSMEQYVALARVLET
ncbi:ribosomal RNA small subunit methyltransferase A [Limisphaera ngatamarikiensis]|uniref:Ribosomal RNA small subunit methyltransferase A n=1 Tax=Limisphaera ngatamarikiensis TaxID=1324935 RepID=A0A6M1RJK4_9BACT|nr:16S rRNA (adenine(1518)-N(6)/adenine(1519)-N(6))-dimethyltransferase RsmA [Limisphaera ngatamarikiensis]NGO40248.1 ribosomal RNA small subunit methyltransferase A [Limisphaera ngatamarikiensis]